MMMTLLLETVAQHIHPIWDNVFFYLFVSMVIFVFVAFRVFTRRTAAKNAELKLAQQQHAAKIDLLRKDHAESDVVLRNEMLKKEEERIHQWVESEKETLLVLNGVSQLLELSENIGRVESKKILDKIEELKVIINNKIE